MAKSIETSNAAFTYQGERVAFGDNHRFYVPSLGRTYDSAQQAKDAIDRKQTELKKIARPKLALLVLDEDGKEHTVTGIHSGNQSLLITPKMTGWRPDIYAACPKTAALIAEITDLAKKQRQLQSRLDKFKITYSWPERVPLSENYADLEKQYAAAIAKGKGED